MAILGSIAAMAGSKALDIGSNYIGAKLSSNIQRDMRKTSYQDTMESMKNAGLNPILAYTNGAVNTPSVTSMGMTGGSASSAREAESSAKLKKEQGYKEWTQAEVNRMQQQYIQQQQDQSSAQVELIKRQQAIAEQTIKLEAEKANSAAMVNAITQSALKAEVHKGNIRSDSPNLQKFEIIMDALGRILGAGNSAKSLAK